jgi:hypothetical protein
MLNAFAVTEYKLRFSKSIDSGMYEYKVLFNSFMRLKEARCFLSGVFLLKGAIYFTLLYPIQWSDFKCFMSHILAQSPLAI